MVIKTKFLLEFINPDIITVTESWLIKEILPLAIPPNTMLPKDRETSNDNVLIALKSELQCSPVSEDVTSSLLSV